MTTRTRQSAAREPVREEPTAAPVRRQRVRQGTDRYAFDRSIIPDGWTYEWKRHSVLGQEDPAYLAELHQLGYSPVPAERHPGQFLPVGYTGAIILGGMILMERPMELEMEARDEDAMRARAQVRGSREQFGMIPQARGFEGPGQHQSAARNTFVRSSYERVDAPAVKYETIDE
jgi:hypothetical protein